MPTNLAAEAQLRPDEARKRIQAALEVADTVDQAAQILGVSRRTLYRLASRLGVPTATGTVSRG